MGYMNKLLSSEELIDKMNEGGWIVSGGHLVREINFVLPVIKASLLGETLRIEAGDRSFEVPNNNIVLTDPWTVEIRSILFMRKQQRKKVEGGGWHEVPAVGVALQVSNPTIEETILEDCKARVQREEEERERRETEALSARRQEFSNNINDKFAGKKLIKIEVVDESKLRLLFEGDSMIEIGTYLDDCCGSGGGSAVVNGISLQGFNQAEYVS